MYTAFIQFNETTTTTTTAEDAGGNESSATFWTLDHDAIAASYPPSAFTFMGVFVSVVGFLGVLANGTVLIIFSRFKRLRSPPANTFIINLAISDLCASGFHSMAAYSNFQGRWAFGRLGCELYAMAVGLFGIVSILTFSAIACERCLAIACPIQGPVAGLSEGRFRVTRTHAKRVCFAIWLHCIVLVVMPLLGWSRYVPEGLLTSCSWDYTTRTASNRAYYIVLLVTGFLIPLAVICASYGRITASVLTHARQMVCLNKQSSAFRRLRRQTEIRTAQVVVMLVLVYLTAWTPYAIVTFIGQFTAVKLSPIATAIPAYFAKTAVVLDPLVYGFSHPHFRTSLKHYLSNVLANQSLGQASVNAHKSVTGAQPASNSAYQSRGMTVYPSNADHFYLAAANNSSSTNNKRRMLRTFRDMSKEDASAAVPASGRVGGVLELHHTCAAIVSVALDAPRSSLASAAAAANFVASKSPPPPLIESPDSPPDGRTWRKPSTMNASPPKTVVTVN